ncbi:putative nucleotide-binding alpha-beta plait domain superfamily, RNA-binding domain superfamily [Helianthus debilis subsp. tardiflorus]
MSLLHNAIRSSSTRLIRTVHPNQGLRSLLSGSLSHRLFSTEPATPTSQSSTKPLFESPSSGLVYGKLSGITKTTLKSDVLSLLEECKLSGDDLKVDYNPSYTPMGMMVQFPSRSAYDAALRAVNRKGRLYRLERADRAIWDSIQPYGGKYVLLQGLPPNAILDDIERFLAGCEYDPSDIRLFSRPGASGPTRMALVRFVSPSAAMSAMITKNRGFCLNNQISMHVLQ